MRRIATITALPLAAVVLAALAACGSTSSTSSPRGAATTTPRVAVVAVTNVYGDIVRQIGGDRVAVTSFISSPDQDPHSYEANAQNQLVVAKARLVIENGGGYDDFLARMVASSHTKATVLDIVALSGKRASEGRSLNEHVWYDLPTVQKAAGAIATALGRADPAGVPQFDRGRSAFVAGVQALIDREATLKRTHAGEAVAVTEPVPGWMLLALGLVDKTPQAFSAAVEEGSDVSPRVLADTLALFKTRQVKALVYNEQTSGPTTEQAAKAARDNGIPVVPVTETLPAGRDYLGWMSGNLDALAKALGE